jgi:hypothetical protein
MWLWSYRPANSESKFILMQRIRISTISGKLDPDPLQSQCRIWIRITTKIQEWYRLKTEPWRAVDAHNACKERRVCRPMVADLHQLEEVQDPDQDPHRSESRIRIRIKVNVGSGCIKVKVRSGSATLFQMLLFLFLLPTCETSRRSRASIAPMERASHSGHLRKVGFNK